MYNLKKIIAVFIIPVIMLFAFPFVGFAAETPIYDPAFDNGKGALFANGTSITISEISGNTVASWDGGSQIIPLTARIFGGGTIGTSFDSSQITMESGTVRSIYGGGFSTDSAQIATVNESSVVINGGTVSTSLYGGGLLYTTTNKTNVVVNGGTVYSVLGGGSSSATIGGVSYSTGTEDHPEDSLTRVNEANVIVNGGTIDSLWGGGQGYSYTGNSILTINGNPDINYVTGGGSNGYTGSISVFVNGGTISTLQTVNRGTVDNSEVYISGGTITTLYVGGEDAVDVTGTVNNAVLNILGGTVTNINAGKSGDLPLDLTKPEYQVVMVDGVVVNDNIPGAGTIITFVASIDQENTILFKNGTKTLNVVITTTPTGYESSFLNIPVQWISSDETVVVVDETGMITGVNPGSAIVSATIAGQTVSANIRVYDTSAVVFIITCILIALVLLCLGFCYFNRRF